MNTQDMLQLRTLAEQMKGWDHLNQCWPVEEAGDEPEYRDWAVGTVTEDDHKYPVMTIDTFQYDQAADAVKLARYYAAANPIAILALIDEIAKLRAAQNKHNWGRS